MSETPFIRARSAAQKAQREEEILAAAAALVDRAGLEGATLSAIAAEAGVVKSGLYRYFESREEILLRVLALEGVALIEEVSGAYAKVSPGDYKTLAEIFAAGCASRPRFCLILSQMASLLERNVSTERIVDMKRGFLSQITQMAEALHAAAPEISLPRSAFAVSALTNLVAGLWPTAHPVPSVVAALEAPDLEPFRVVFEASLATATEAMLRGLAEMDREAAP